MILTTLRTARRSASLTLAGAAVATALAVVPASASAQGADLPAARTLVDKHIAAAGGRTALERAATSHAKGTFTIPSAGLSGPLEVYSAPNRQSVRIELAGLGVLRSGFDGITAWSLDPISGARVLEGAERSAIVDATTPGSAFRDSTVITSMQTTSREEIAGVACYKVRVLWTSGRESHDCYAVESGLLHASMAKQPSPMGEMDLLVIVQDYKDFGGIKMPTKTVQQVAGQEMMMTFDSMEMVTPPADAFALPPEIQALVKPAGASGR